MWNATRIYKISKNFATYSNSLRILCEHYKRIQVNHLKTRTNKQPHEWNTGHTTSKTLVGLSILSWLGFTDDDKKKESELIMTLKRAVLCTKREQYDKAEQMLHLALRLAQQQQNEQGVLYAYDLMANLAMDRLELDKAEKLFISVMQMLLSSGVKEDNLKIIHISLKLARICHLKAEDEKAKIGYTWCLKTIDARKNADIDSRTLYGVILDWYAQFLLDMGDIEASKIHLNEAYNVCREIKGHKSEQSMLLLNDLGITSWRSGDLNKAEAFLKESYNIGKTMEDQSHVGVVQANLGLVYLQKGLCDNAHKLCKEAWKLGTKYDNQESIGQATYCLDQINSVLSPK